MLDEIAKARNEFDGVVAAAHQVLELVYDVGKGVEERAQKLADFGLASIRSLHGDVEPLHVVVEAAQHSARVVGVEEPDHVEHGLPVLALLLGEVCR